MELTWIGNGKKIGLKTKITIKTDKKHLFIFNIYELWPHRYRSAMITARQFTAALVLSRSDGDFEPSVEVFQQWASYAGVKEPKINQLVKGRKTRVVKTIGNCRGNNSDQKMGELFIQSPEQFECQQLLVQLKSIWFMEPARHLWHICCHCLECRFWASAFFQTKNRRSAGRENQMKPEFLSTLHQATQREIPSNSSQIGKTFQAHQKTFVPCQKFRKCTDCYQKLETVSIKNYEKCRGTKLILHCHIVLKKGQMECERLLDHLKRWCPSKKRVACWKNAQKLEQR